MNLTKIGCEVDLAASDLCVNAACLLDNETSDDQGRHDDGNDDDEQRQRCRQITSSATIDQNMPVKRLKQQGCQSRP